MDVWLTYFIKTLLLPQSILWLCVLLGAVWMRRPQPNGGFRMLLLTLGVWYGLSTPVLSKVLAKSIEAYPALSLKALPTIGAQAIVVIGGGVRQFAPEYPDNFVVNSYTLERLRYTAMLAKHTHLPVLVAGGKVFDTVQYTEAEIMAKTLEQDFGVAVSWQENTSRNTAENARNSYTILYKAGIKDIILVTHALHMPRAAKAFTDSGFNVIPASTTYMADRTLENVFSFMPSAKAFMDSTIVLHEYLGSFWVLLKS